MLWLYDTDRVLTKALPEHESLVETRRYYDHSSFSGRFPRADYADLLAAVYATVDTSSELYLVESVREVTEGLNSYCEVGGRSATALLEQRTLNGEWSWTDDKAQVIIKALVDSLTGDRVLPGVFVSTAGSTLGDDITMQRSHVSMDEAVRDILNASGLALSARLGGTNGDEIALDVYGTTTIDDPIGEAYGNASGSSLLRDVSNLSNYAIVLGEEPEEHEVVHTASNLSTGGTVSGTAADIKQSDGVLWTISEATGAIGILLYLDFAISADEDHGRIEIEGWYQGSTGHAIDGYVKDVASDTYVKTAPLLMPNSTAAGTFSMPFYATDIDRSTGLLAIKLQHNSATMNASHRLRIDKVAAFCHATRVREDVDQSGTDPIRELYVDARDLQSTLEGGATLSHAEYHAMLAARGAEKLAEARTVYFADATLTTARNPGDVVWYDSGRWTAELMVSEAVRVIEGGNVTHSATIGVPPVSLKRTVKGWTA